MNYSIDELFPLFSPEGEKRWVPGWDYTKIQVTYTYTALSDSGKAFIAAFNDAAYDDFINEWGKLLSNYLEHND